VPIADGVTAGHTLKAATGLRQEWSDRLEPAKADLGLSEGTPTGLRGQGLTDRRKTRVSGAWST
jgi:hypothetical protein